MNRGIPYKTAGGPEGPPTTPTLRRHADEVIRHGALVEVAEDRIQLDVWKPDDDGTRRVELVDELDVIWDDNRARVIVEDGTARAAPRTLNFSVCWVDDVDRTRLTVCRKRT